MNNLISWGLPWLLSKAMPVSVCSLRWPVALCGPSAILGEAKFHDSRGLAGQFVLGRSPHQVLSAGGE